MPKIDIPAYNKIYKNILNSVQGKRELEDANKSKNENPIDEAQKKWDMNEKIVDLFSKNIENDLELRKQYAKILIIMLGIMLISLILIFLLVGFGKLKYSDFAFNLFITGGMAEVFFLVRIIVKYLFNDNLKEALTIMIKYNNQFKYNPKTQQKYNNKSSDKPREI